jgi:serine/threonine protein kinase
MFKKNGHLQVIDFGTSKFIGNGEKLEEKFAQLIKRQNAHIKTRTMKSFVGTSQYVSPEMLEETECGYAGDI